MSVEAILSRKPKENKALFSRRTTGFSLIELSLVLAIFTILVMLAMPALTLIQSTRADTQSREVREMLVNARNLSRTTIRCVEVVVTPPHTLSYTAYETCSPSLASPDTTVTREYGEFITLHPFSSGNLSLVFNTEGGTTESAPVTIEVANDYRASVVYTIYPALGAVRSQ